MAGLLATDLFAAVGGFILWPTAGSIVNSLVQKSIQSDDVQTKSAIAAIVHVGGAIAAWQIAEHGGFDSGLHAFFRGGMWGEVVAAPAAFALSHFKMDAPPGVVTTSFGGLPRGQKPLSQRDLRIMAARVR